MATWSGWENQLLNAAKLPTTAANRQFLDAWNAHAESNCGNNPIDISHRLTGSTNCHALPGTQLSAQRYTSHAQAATAFSDQVHSGKYSSILGALQHSNAFTTNDNLGVELDLLTWGSAKFNAYYGSRTAPPPPPPSPGVGIHKGWSDLQRSLSKGRLGSRISATNRKDSATLRALRRARKVRIR